MTSWAPSDAAQVHGRFAVRSRPWAFWAAGQLRVTSPSGRGTVVTAELPCGS